MQAIIVVGLGFGDEGKGSVVDYLVREYNAKTVVRFNGGPQAAHNVVLPDGTHHTFSQFGSGTLAGAHTFLAEPVLVNPLNLTKEAEHLIPILRANPYDKLTIDPMCKVITPMHIKSNELIPMGETCGQGIGEVMSGLGKEPTLYFHEIANRDKVVNKLVAIGNYRNQRLSIDEIETTAEVYKFVHDSVRIETFDSVNKLDNLIFEGAQGVLLDEWYGFHPYTTWSTTTFENALNLLRLSNYTGEVTKLGLIRSYMTRHGKGPFPTEKPFTYTMSDHNSYNEWQGQFRVGPFDTTLMNYAIEVAKPDALGVTCLDQYNDGFVSTNYDGVKALAVSVSRSLKFQELLTQVLEEVKPIYQPVSSVLTYIKQNFSTPVMLESYGPTHEGKKVKVPA